jgi:hypothetical protein
MALKIAKNVGLTDIVTGPEQKPYRKKSDLTQVDTIPPGQEANYEPNPAYNPITTQHPIAGSTVEMKVWLFNDNPAKRYESITIDPTDTTSTDESNWAQLAPDNAGSPGTYFAAGVALSMANISDSNVGKPFWVKVTTPSVADSQNKTDITLKVTSTEFAV